MVKKIYTEIVDREKLVFTQISSFGNGKKKSGYKNYLLS